MHVLSLISYRLNILVHKPPYSLQEPPASFDAFSTPFQIPFRGRREQHEKPGCIRPVFIDNLVGIHGVPLRLGHLGAIH